MFLKKVTQRSVRLVWSAEKKLNVKQTVQRRSNNWAKLTKYSSCTSSW